MTYPKVVSNLCVKKDFQYFSIRKIWTRHEFRTFTTRYLDLAQMTLGQCHEIPLGHKQSLSEVWTFIVSPYERYKLDRNFAIFSVSDIDFVQMTLVYGLNTFSGQKQSFCDKKLFNN